MMDTIVNYISPIKRLGKSQYSFFFPLITSVAVCILSEIFAVEIIKNPNIVGIYIIWVNIASVIYFAFRDGLKGGIIAAVVPIFYYFYIIYTRQPETQRMTSIETTITLGVLYLLMAGVIGWLRQTIDTLIESESNEKRRLQMIVEQLPVGVTITDSKGRVVQTNKRVESIIGVKIPKDFVVGDEPLVPTKMNGRNYQPSQGPLAQVLSGNKHTITKEFTITRKDGKVLHLQSSASAIHNHAGKLIAAAQIVNDVTQQRELENRKDDFVNMASHELKTPLTSLKLYIDALSMRIKQFDDPKATKTLQNIRHQTERLQNLVNDLLDVSRLQTGKLTFKREEFRLDKLVEGAIEDLDGMAKNQKIILVSKTPITVHADKFRIYQVLTNLITNAVKYSSSGKDVKVKVKRQDGKALVIVQDYGIGIAKEQQKKVFERLYQVIDDKENTFPGFGMGLYISKEIIRRHRGTIWVESQGRSEKVPVSKQGSTFYFTLPLQ